MINRRKTDKHKSETSITTVEARKPTTRQTLIATIILCSLAVVCIIIGMTLKLAYGPSLYYRDENYWLAVTGLILVAVSFPIGITSICLLNTLFRIKQYIEYTEARKRMLESEVSATHTDKMVN
ncbi:unnamed protein product [Heterobilharzia americana]|nr:unnamed protein product [Heterobilharzia americana]CAH8633664.1 unnamed protein product [Heterobilharzia americana]